MHKKMWMKKDKRGEIGIGTMIVFIAMVLVAAVAASVLISTANQVREQAQSTGDQAINNVASGFVVQDVVAQVNQTTGNTIDNLTVYMRLSAGSPPINLDNVVITLVCGDLNMFLAYGDTASDSTYSAVRKVNIANLAWTAGSHVVGQGDMIQITITASDHSLGIGYNTYGELKIMPAYGQVTLISFQTGESFGNEYVSLK
ncbi:MAG: archaellin/type IV pilin N-terminal domain-containing protein [Methanomassiliicoccales archaeon]